MFRPGDIVITKPHVIQEDKQFVGELMRVEDVGTFDECFWSEPRTCVIKQADRYFRCNPINPPRYYLDKIRREKENVLIYLTKYEITLIYRGKNVV